MLEPRADVPIPFCWGIYFRMEVCSDCGLRERQQGGGKLSAHT